MVVYYFDLSPSFLHFLCFLLVYLYAIIGGILWYSRKNECCVVTFILTMEAREKDNTLDMYMSIQTTKGIRASSDKPLLASFFHLFWCGDGTIYRERSEAITA